MCSFLCFAFTSDGGDGFSPCWSVWCEPDMLRLPWCHPHHALWATSLGPVIWKARFLVLMRAQFIILWQTLCFEQNGNFATASYAQTNFHRSWQVLLTVKSWTVQVRKKLQVGLCKLEKNLLTPEDEKECCINFLGATAVTIQLSFKI